MIVFVTGGTGYMGSRLIPLLLARGHSVRALVRPASARTLPAGCTAISGDALDAKSYSAQVAGAEALVHLIGVAHPSPAKAEQFQTVDLASTRAAVSAAKGAGVLQFVYVSVAHPAPVMEAYIAARSEGEALIRSAGLNATMLRPWYVLGPGHRWPVVLKPFYWLAERFPGPGETARRLGLVTVQQMVGALVWSIENPSDGVRILDVPAIRARGSALSQPA
ncbi:MAG TPA: NAD(P)H-binding protein [Bryobacteraceae bacterium]|nr:NAD(P)H-binding protein [Bryobacteraceae bacterium]